MRPPASSRELAHRIEQSPAPARLTLDGLGKAHQIACVSGVELDHAAGQKALIGTDEAALRRLEIIWMRGKVDAEKRALDRGACGRLQRRGPTAQQDADDTFGDHLDTANHLVHLLPL